MRTFNRSHDQRGASMLEFTLLAAILCFGLIAALSAMRSDVSDTLTLAAQAMNGVGTMGGNCPLGEFPCIGDGSAGDGPDGPPGS
ncbi:MAG: hypothetical protein KDD66_18110 [Bdellovibrionales bacterium]|nr:hypothetical protein [Bdellovibrionales bacterium]